MATEATWKPHEKHGRLTKQSDLPDTGSASPGAAEESRDVQPAGTTMKAWSSTDPGRLRRCISAKSPGLTRSEAGS